MKELFTAIGTHGHLLSLSHGFQAIEVQTRLKWCSQEGNQNLVIVSLESIDNNDIRIGQVPHWMVRLFLLIGAGRKRLYEA